MKLSIIPVAALLLAACQQTTPDPDAAGDTAPAGTGSNSSAPTQVEPTAARPSPEDDRDGEVAIVGEYRLAGYDGKPIDLPHGIAVSITADRIRYTSQCVSGTWSYRRSGESFVTERVPEVICQRGLYPEEEALDAVFDDLRSAAINRANGMELRGGEHTITLFSQ